MERYNFCDRNDGYWHLSLDRDVNRYRWLFYPRNVQMIEKIIGIVLLTVVTTYVTCYVVGCREDHQPLESKKSTPFKMACTEASMDSERCENSEVVCYFVLSRAAWCYKK